MHSTRPHILGSDSGEQDDRDDTAVLTARHRHAGGVTTDSMDLKLSGTTALITGAASGIGRATALALAAEGARVALLDRDGVALGETARECPGAVFSVADVTDPVQVARAVEAAVDALGRLDAVVCCAGVSGPVGSPIDDISVDEWNAVFAVNVTGAFLVLSKALPALRAAGSGSVVLLASDSAFVASAGMVAYCASKAALVQFARSLSVDLAGSGIRVNTVAPSVVDTPMSRGDLGAEAFGDPSFPVQTADEVASHVVYLVSPRSRAINGATILSDFGYSARSGFPA